MSIVRRISRPIGLIVGNRVGVEANDDNLDLVLLGSVVVGESDEYIPIMCLNRKWLSITKMLNGGSVFMGNDHAYKTIGIWKVRLKFHDGSVRTLSDVWYVPNLKKMLKFVCPHVQIFI